MPGPNCKRSLVTPGGQTTHKRPRAKSCLSCHQSLARWPVQHLGLPLHGQHDNSSPCKQQRGYALSLAGQPYFKLWQWCLQRAVLITAEHLPGKLNDVAASGDPALHKRVRCRPVCLTPNSSYSEICQLETRPRCDLDRCNEPGLVPSKRLDLSTVQSNLKSIEQGIAGQSRFALSGPTEAGTALMGSSSESPYQEPCHDPKLQTSAKGPSVSSTNPPNLPQASFIPALSHIREQHQTEGFSEEVTEILLSATRASTHKT